MHVLKSILTVRESPELHRAIATELSGIPDEDITEDFINKHSVEIYHSQKDKSVLNN